VSFWGNVPEYILKLLYSGCEGVLCTSIREDFGIVPLEAMASGNPVVAVDEGGYRETVVDMITGCLVDAYVPDIIEGIEDCPNYPEMCIEQANRFDYEVFKTTLQERIRQV
jgi:glycosyltransferase involved in cell wall biosynthesis